MECVIQQSMTHFLHRCQQVFCGSWCFAPGSRSLPNRPNNIRRIQPWWSSGPTRTVTKVFVNCLKRIFIYLLTIPFDRCKKWATKLSFQYLNFLLLNWKKMSKPKCHQKKFYKSKHTLTKTDCHFKKSWTWWKWLTWIITCKAVEKTNKKLKKTIVTCTTIKKANKRWLQWIVTFPTVENTNKRTLKPIVTCTTVEKMNMKEMKTK
jgi:hypothetical protein